MADKSKIEWTDATWNPVRGCSLVSAGCTNCYAMREAHRHKAYAGLTRSTEHGPVWTGDVRLVAELLEQPLRWKRPRQIFVNSMSDLFHEQVPDEFIDKVWAVMLLAPQHGFQLLTKRPDRMQAYLDSDSVYSRTLKEADQFRCKHSRLNLVGVSNPRTFPVKWIHLGVSCEDQKTADERIPWLLKTPAAVRWVSAEPLLGPIDFSKWMDACSYHCDHQPDPHGEGEYGHRPERAKIDWVVTGGESGPRARPMHPDWSRSIRDQCQGAGVPFFFKQWGEWITEAGFDPGRAGGIKIKPAWMREDGAICDEMLPHSSDVPAEGSKHRWIKCARIGKKAAGATLDGRQWKEYPV